MELVMTGSDALDLSAGGISSTFFVPTDAAFEELGATVIEDALKNRSFLKTVSSNHFVLLFRLIGKAPKDGVACIISSFIFEFIMQDCG